MIKTANDNDRSETSSGFDYSEPAELFGGHNWTKGRNALAYRRFESAGEAIRYVMEELDEATRRPCVLEVNEKRLTHVDVRRLYESKEYPLPRRAGKETDGS